MTQRLTADAPDPANRAAFFRTLAALLGPASVVVNVVVLMVSRTWPLKGAALVLMAAAPTAPLLASMVCVGVWLRLEPDEFQRAATVEAMMWATGLTLAAATLFGFVALYAGAAVSPLAPALCYPAWLCAYAAARGLVWLRYR